MGAQLPCCRPGGVHGSHLLILSAPDGDLPDACLLFPAADSEKRQMYDRFGEQGLKQGGGPSGGGPGGGFHFQVSSCQLGGSTLCCCCRGGVCDRVCDTLWAAAA